MDKQPDEPRRSEAKTEHLVSERLKLPSKKIPVSQDRWDYFVSKYGAEKTESMCVLKQETPHGE